MNQIPVSAMTFAKTLWQKANDGEISQMTLNEGMQEIASLFFDGSVGKMLKSEVGKVFLRPATRIPAHVQTDLLKSEGRRPGSDQENLDDSDDGSMSAEDCDKAIKALVKTGMSYDQAASTVHRLESKSKGFDH